MALAFASQAHMVVVVAQGHTQDFLGFLLLDHKPVQVGFDIARLLVEGEIFRQRRLIWSLGCVGQVGLVGRGASEVLAHKILQLTLKFFGRGRSIERLILHTHSV